MFIETFKTTFQAIFELVLLGSVGFFILKAGFIHEEGLKILSDLVVGLFLPLFMFSEIIKKFDFSLYPDWWVFPIYSLLITVVGFACGLAAMGMVPSLRKNQEEFCGVVTFQNSGYLPLPLVASLLAPEKASEMFIYIFLFLLGFNMTIFSFGVLLFAPKKKESRFHYEHMFSAPVVATLLALACVFFKVSAVLPPVLTKPVETLGRCAIPLSILVVGGNLASLKPQKRALLKPLSLALAIKLVTLPLIFLGFLVLVRPRPLVGLLILLQAAMPPAALLSVISKNQDHSGSLVNQSIFYGHLAGVLTIPLFLTLFALLWKI